MQLINQLRKLLKRKANAKKFGLNFVRTAKFQQFDSLVVNGKTIQLQVPESYDTWLIQLEIFIDDCYRLQEFANKDVSTILDVGANLGLFSVAARAFFEQATIHAYEPNPNLLTYLSHQADVGKFQCFSEAIGTQNGYCSLIFNEAPGLTQSRLNDAAGRITQTSLKTAIERLGGSVDIAKVDIEGAEWELFEEQDMWQPIKTLVMEYHLCEKVPTVESAIAQVEKLGFSLISQEIVFQNSTGIIIANRR